MDIGNQQRVIIVESEPAEEGATVEPARLIEAKSAEKVGAHAAGAWPLHNFDPLEIYLHVRNNFRFEHYFGLLKGAQATLETGGGSDWDLAALLGERDGRDVRDVLIPAHVSCDTSDTVRTSICSLFEPFLMRVESDDFRAVAAEADG